MKMVIARIWFQKYMSSSEFSRLICKKNLFITKLNQIDEPWDVVGPGQIIDKLLREFKFEYHIVDYNGGGELSVDSLPSDTLSKYDRSALYIIELISTPATREAVVGDLLEARDKIME